MPSPIHPKPVLIAPAPNIKSLHSIQSKPVVLLRPASENESAGSKQSNSAPPATVSKIASPIPSSGSSSSTATDSNTIATPLTTTATTTTSSSSSTSLSKKFQCPHCIQTFTRHHNLKSHLLIHSQEKKFVCQTCSSKFRRIYDLKRHLKLHTGERPHLCEKCGRRFARGDALVRHIKTAGTCSTVPFEGEEGADGADSADGKVMKLSSIGSINDNKKGIELQSTLDAEKQLVNPNVASRKRDFETSSQLGDDVSETATSSKPSKSRRTSSSSQDNEVVVSVLGLQGSISHKLPSLLTGSSGSDTHHHKSLISVFDRRVSEPTTAFPSSVSIGRNRMYSTGEELAKASHHDHQHDYPKKSNSQLTLEPPVSSSLSALMNPVDHSFSQDNSQLGSNKSSHYLPFQELKNLPLPAQLNFTSSKPSQTATPPSTSPSSSSLSSSFSHPTTRNSLSPLTNLSTTSPPPPSLLPLLPSYPTREPKTDPWMLVQMLETRVRALEARLNSAEGRISFLENEIRMKN